MVVTIGYVVCGFLTGAVCYALLARDGEDDRISLGGLALLVAAGWPFVLFGAAVVGMGILLNRSARAEKKQAKQQAKQQVNHRKLSIAEVRALAKACEAFGGIESWE
ncbi:MAG TPA: hypothetical protein VNA25_30580 [Phycisphaerae bacterium]|nr:hypothetical protein [Phycisphaerae bacterium]